MDRYNRNTEVLNVEGYDIYFTRYADAILSINLKDLKDELEIILNNFYITKQEILTPGGNKHIITINLEALLNKSKWKKIVIEDEHIVMGKTMVAQTHEIDHFYENKKGNAAIEIEWNNKDPFYDRDLENFRKLHSLGAISIGIIITRAENLNEMIPDIYTEALEEIYPLDKEKLSKRFKISDKAKTKYEPFFLLPKEEQIKKIRIKMLQSRFGESTTHMNKLLNRLQRGLGDPCPLVVIGIGKERLK